MFSKGGLVEEQFSFGGAKFQQRIKNLDFYSFCVSRAKRWGICSSEGYVSPF